jgi:large subunit ribosomal protein L4
LDDFPFENIKTKNAVKVLKNLNLVTEKILIVIPEKDEKIIKSFRNIPNVKYILVDFVNPYDLLTYKKVLFFEEAVKKLEEIFVK